VKLGTENKTKTIIALALVVLAAVLLVRAFRGAEQDAAPEPRSVVAGSQSSSGMGARGTGTNPPARKRPSTQLTQTLDPTLRFDLLKASEDVSYKGTGRDIFRSQPEPVIPTPLPPDKQPNVVQTPPPPPPIELKFYGFASRKDGYKRIFLLKGEDVFIAKEGDIVDRRYKIVHIGQNSVDVEDVLTNNHQTLPLGAG
jgi:hypothetical protein